jgi:hypothetical protein
MPADAHHCLGDGYLAGADLWLPDADFDHHWLWLAPVTGCNRLRCLACGQRVTAGPRDDGVLGRAFECRCRRFEVPSRLGVHEPLDPITEATTPYRCDGHPPLALPARLDGVDLDDGVDWRALARAVFAGELAVPVPDAAAWMPGFWIQRLYHVLDGARAPALGRAVSELVVDAVEPVRLAALRFVEVASGRVARTAEAWQARRP